MPQDAGLDEPRSMTTPIPPGSIVVAHDHSKHSAAALAWGLEQGSLEDRPVDIVHLLNVTEAQRNAWLSTSEAGLRWLKDFREQSRTHLDEVATLARQEYPELNITAHLLERDARHGLMEISSSAHMLVMGSHGRGPLTSPLLGSVSAAVTQRADCPTVVVRPSSEQLTVAPTAAGVLVGVDATAESWPVIEFAFRQASLRHLPLTAVHCLRDAIAAYAGEFGFPTKDELDRARSKLAESVAGLAERHPEVTVERHLDLGLLDHVVNDPEKPWDLVVVGGRRHGAWHRLLIGSTTTAVLERAHCPVAVVPEAVTQDAAVENLFEHSH